MGDIERESFEVFTSWQVIMSNMFDWGNRIHWNVIGGGNGGTDGRSEMGTVHAKASCDDFVTTTKLIGKKPCDMGSSSFTAPKIPNFDTLSNF